MARACGAGVDAITAAWGAAARDTDPADVWRSHVAAGVGVACHGGAGYPHALVDDVEPPIVLFHHGDPEAVADVARVAIVGTRNCTRYGLDVAFELGRDLAAGGVVVVSGLAAGIDAAAHAGALSLGAAAHSAPPVAVVGSGLDVVYPRRNAELWRAVAKAGAVFSEAPLGARPERWRFPARNRIIAGLADVVVVVESRERGGSMHTVAEAIDRDRPVMAVPGPVRSAASTGTNRLLGDGAMPCCGADDVLVALGLSPASGRNGGPDGRPDPDPGHRAVLEAVGWQPATADQLAARTGLALGPVAVAVATLEAQGWIARRDGWIERVARAEP